MIFHKIGWLGLLLTLFSSQKIANTPSTIFKSIQEIRSPAGKNSGQPNLYTAEDGRVFLSWIEPGIKKKHSFRFSVLKKNRWLLPRIINEGNNWFVNWADFPSLIAFKNQQIATHWLAKISNDTHAYKIYISQSPDNGLTWQPPLTPHSDTTATEHGFVSMLAWEDDQIMVIWLDGHNYAKTSQSDHHHASLKPEMTLRTAFIDKNGNVSGETELDNRACDCCQTSLARTSDGAIGVYRDRSETEVRDISLVCYHNGSWSAPQVVHNDGWKINGCPVNGPSVAAKGEKVAIAWFTAVNDFPSVKVSFSPDQGHTFGRPIIVDQATSIGRVDVVMLPNGAALVSWVASSKNSTEICCRLVRADGSQEPIVRLAQTNATRVSGFPQMTRSGSRIYFAWTDDSHSRVKTAVAILKNNN